MKIGMTTTVPVEPVYASGNQPVDLNNLFINSEDPASLVAQAETDGLPRNICAWVKGIYSSVVNNGIEKIVIPVTGDCSNCVSLGEILEYRGVEVYDFYYPRSPDPEAVRSEISRMGRELGVTDRDILAWFEKLAPVRTALHELDHLAWERGTVRGADLHDCLVGSSDFSSDPDAYLHKVIDLVRRAAAAQENYDFTRIGLTGIPPIVSDLFDVLEKLGARIVYTETARQFSLPASSDMIGAYSQYTYPLALSYRIEDMKREIEKRKLKALIHYQQSFCHRQLESFILNQELPVPVLFLEGEMPEPVNSQQLMRLEAFVSMIN